MSDPGEGQDLSWYAEEESAANTEDEGPAQEEEAPPANAITEAVNPMDMSRYQRRNFVLGFYTANYEAQVGKTSRAQSAAGMDGVLGKRSCAKRRRVIVCPRRFSPSSRGFALRTFLVGPALRPNSPERGRQPQNEVDRRMPSSVRLGSDGSRSRLAGGPDHGDMLQTSVGSRHAQSHRPVQNDPRRLLEDYDFPAVRVSRLAWLSPAPRSGG